MTSMSRSNTDEPTINTDNLSFEDKYKVYQKILRVYNDKISELQEELENNELYKMKNKFLWELIRIPYKYYSVSISNETLRDEINYYTGRRDRMIEDWNRLNTSCASSCLE